MNLKRTIKDHIKNYIFKGKIITIYGPRQVGKTTLVNEIAKAYGEYGYFSCDEPDVRDKLTNKTSFELKQFLGHNKLVIIDEAQRVENIGITLKLLIDNYPETQIIATGSSSFELANKIKEALTGREVAFHLHPFTFLELSQLYQTLDLYRQKEERMIFGMYPDVVLEKTIPKEKMLSLISNEYLYKDLLSYEGIRKPMLLEKLARLLATQTGSLISFSELANTLDVSKQTVENYIKILEQAFIIFSILPYSENVRSELTKKRKIYFYDTGVRSALLENTTMLDRRIDTGFLFENMIISERVKYLSNQARNVKFYFWRTHDGQEIDLIEIEQNQKRAFEIKWQKPTNYKTPPKWKNNYPNIPVTLIHKDNFLDYLL
ncbi:ATP-binding protein [Candidatus Nomurabacteria bacterium]|nr:ATP-binding protein [Candidatus Nomurabacteria bacterium]